jgi:hypothetical protein
VFFMYELSGIREVMFLIFHMPVFGTVRYLQKIGWDYTGCPRYERQSPCDLGSKTYQQKPLPCCCWFTLLAPCKQAWKVLTEAGQRCFNLI